MNPRPPDHLLGRVAAAVPARTFLPTGVASGAGVCHTLAMDNTTTYPPINEARPAPAYEVGSKVTYLCGNTYRTGIVTEKHADIKNGRPGFVMDDGSRFGVWGYDYQLTMVWS